MLRLCLSVLFHLYGLNLCFSSQSMLLLYLSVYLCIYAQPLPLSTPRTSTLSVDGAAAKERTGKSNDSTSTTANRVSTKAKSQRKRNRRPTSTDETTTESHAIHPNPRRCRFHHRRSPLLAAISPRLPRLSPAPTGRTIATSGVNRAASLLSRDHQMVEMRVARGMGKGVEGVNGASGRLGRRARITVVSATLCLSLHGWG